MAGARAAQRARTREALIGSAADVFGRRGFGGATVDEIAAGAGVTVGALYDHFTSKADLFLAVYSRFADEVVAASAAAVAAPGGTPADAADAWMLRHDTDPSELLLHLEFATQALSDPRLRRDIARRVSAMRAGIADMIERYAAEQRMTLPVPAEELAAVVRALGLGLAMDRLVDPPAVPAELFGRAVRLLFELLPRNAGPAPAGPGAPVE